MSIEIVERTLSAVKYALSLARGTRILQMLIYERGSCVGIGHVETRKGLGNMIEIGRLTLSQITSPYLMVPD